MPDNKTILLDDALTAIQFENDKVRALLNDILEDYFALNLKDQDSRAYILYSFSHYGILASIICDITKKIADIIHEVQEAN